MNYKNLIKILVFFCIFATMFFVTTAKSFASDYQYKVLDPKYNPQAEQLLDGTLSSVPVVEPIDTDKKFDFGTFFAVFALVVFPIFILSLALKTFKKLSENIPGTEKQTLGNIKIEPRSENSSNFKKTQSSVTNTISNTTGTEKNSGPNIRPAINKIAPSSKLPQSANSSINRYFSSPVRKIPDPMLLNTSPLSKNKGLCLVEYNNKYSLIGYINNEIFMLNQFESLNSKEIRSRLSESVDTKDRYIVRVGNYKALVEVSDTKMNLLLEL